MTSHPGVTGREGELRALSDAVRRLISLTVTNTAPAGETADIASGLDALASRLEAFVPTPHPPRYLNADRSDAMDEERMPYDVVIGPFNPLALPVRIELDPPRAIGHACFTVPYEGPPGCVHGAVIAGAFDMVCNAANHMAGLAGPTARLTVRYRRPTLLGVDLVFEAQVLEARGRRTTTTARIVQDGMVTAEAQGLFVALDRREVMTFDRRIR